MPPALRKGSEGVEKSTGHVILSPPCFSAGEGSPQLLFGLSRLRRTAGMLRSAQHDSFRVFHTFSAFPRACALTNPSARLEGSAFQPSGGEKRGCLRRKARGFPQGRRQSRFGMLAFGAFDATLRIHERPSHVTRGVGYNARLRIRRRSSGRHRWKRSRKRRSTSRNANGKSAMGHESP